MLLWWYNNIVLNKGKVLEFFFNSFYLEREEIHQKKEWPNKICMLFWIFVPKLSLFKRAGNSNKNLWFLTLSLILRTFVGCNNNIVFNFASYMNKFSSLNLVYIYTSITFLQAVVPLRWSHVLHQAKLDLESVPGSFQNLAIVCHKANLQNSPHIPKKIIIIINK